jgi:hypothetical protein
MHGTGFCVPIGKHFDQSVHRLVFVCGHATLTPTRQQKIKKLSKSRRFFVHFFRAKFHGKFFPKNCWKKMGIFHKKSFEKSFPQKSRATFRGI